MCKGGAIGGPLDPGDIARVFKGMATAAELGPTHKAGISGHSSASVLPRIWFVMASSYRR